MDHLLTPAPSFRPSRPVTRNRNRNRNRHISPSPRPGSRRPFVEPASNTMFITTDCDPLSSSPDSDLIFNMSPVHSHFLASSPSGSEAINVMTLRNRTRTAASSPPLSPLLYSFPRPSHAHAHARQHPDAHTSSCQNLGAPTLHRRVRTLSSSCGVEMPGAARDSHSLSSSLLDTASPSITPTEHTKHITVPHASRPSRLSSSPIPIPRPKTRRADPGPFIARPSPSIILSDHSTYDINDPALPSSGLAGCESLRDRGRLHHPSFTPPEGSAVPSMPLCRIEGFDDTQCDTQEEQDLSLESVIDSRSPATPSTAYSYSGSGPFRFSTFLDIGGKTSGSSDLMLRGSGGGFPLGDWENLKDRKGL